MVPSCAVEGTYAQGEGHFFPYHPMILKRFHKNPLPDRGKFVFPSLLFLVLCFPEVDGMVELEGRQFLFWDGAKAGELSFGGRY